MSVDVKSDKLGALVDENVEVKQLGTGFTFTEGPVWSTKEQALYYSDIPGDRRYRWTESAGAELVAFPTFKGNGMAYDIEGRLIVCEHVNSEVTRFHENGWRETVCFHHDGVYLNSPNDLVSRKRDGYIYFTDPDYGRWNDWIGCKREPLLGYTAVFRVPHEGGPAELVTEPVPGRARCTPCAHEWPVGMPPRLSCPVCEGTAVELVSGRELQIAAVHWEDGDPVRPAAREPIPEEC